MENKDIEKLLSKYKTMSNKELANEMLILESDFKIMKNQIKVMYEILSKVHSTYNLIYEELNDRLKFEK